MSGKLALAERRPHPAAGSADRSRENPHRTARIRGEALCNVAVTNACSALAEIRRWMLKKKTAEPGRAIGPVIANRNGQAKGQHAGEMHGPEPIPMAMEPQINRAAKGQPLLAVTRPARSRAA